MKFISSVVILLVPFFLNRLGDAIPTTNSPSSQVKNLDKEGAVEWQAVDGGHFATLTGGEHPALRRAEHPSSSLNNLDKINNVNWEDVKGGKFATLELQRRTSRLEVREITGPSEWIKGFRYINTVDIGAFANSQVMCYDSGSEILNSVLVDTALKACGAFMNQTKAGNLAKVVWNVYQIADVALSNGQPGYLNWFLGSMDENPTTLTDDLCTALFNGMKGLCNVNDETYGKAAQAGGWVLLGDPDSYSTTFKFAH